jgi:hypothetical protein
MPLYKRGCTFWYRFRWNGQQYRGSCKSSKLSEAKKVESLVLAQLLEYNSPPGSQKIPNLAEFSNASLNGWIPCRRIARRNREPAGITTLAGNCWREPR